MRALDYQRADLGGRGVRVHDVAPVIVAALLTVVACIFSTVTKWHFQAKAGRILLNYLPYTERARLLVEDLPGYSSTVGLLLIAAWAVFRAVRARTAIPLIALPVCFVAWWVVLFVVVGNSFEAFP